MNRLFVDLKENCHGEITGTIKIPADGSFTIEALLEVLDHAAAGFGVPTQELLADLYNYKRTHG